MALRQVFVHFNCTKLSLSLGRTLFSPPISGRFEGPPLMPSPLAGLNQTRGIGKGVKKRRSTHPFKWWVQKERKPCPEGISAENQEFIQDVIQEKFAQVSPLKDQQWEAGAAKEWTPESKRCGIIAKKIGIYPMWTQSGKRTLSTLLQVVDNHVIRYYSPEEYQENSIPQVRWRSKGYGCMIVGAGSTDPQRYAASYCGLFKEAGVMPKAKLTRMLVTDDAKLQPGTPLYANHFRPGDYVDVFGVTIDRGWQGVIRRFGFKGGPASHGTTKAHRRGGSIGHGRKAGGPYRGKKMPGHMGCERKTLNGLKIDRINTKYNVIYVRGPAVPGAVGDWVYIYDSKCVAKQHSAENPPPFPTYFPQEVKEPVHEQLYSPEIHKFEDPTLFFVETEEEKKVARTGAKLAKVRTKS